MGKAVGREQPKRETWREWQAEHAPEPPLMTRAEVLRLLEIWQIEPAVEERTLRYWETQGLLPRPVREHRDGVTRTWYPSWMPDLVAILRLKQEIGRKVGRQLADLRDELRQEARRLALNPRAYPFVPPPVRDPQQPRSDVEIWGAPTEHDRTTGFAGGPRYRPPDPLDPPKLPDWLGGSVISALRLVIRDQYARHNFATASIEVRLLDAEKKDRRYVVPLPADFDLGPQRTALERLLLSARATNERGKE